MRLTGSCHIDSLTVEHFTSKHHHRCMPAKTPISDIGKIVSYWNMSPDSIDLPPSQLSGKRSGHAIAEVVDVELDAVGHG